MENVNEDRSFKFKNLCPYCNSDIVVKAEGWTQDDNGFWFADTLDVNCISEPDIDHPDYEDFINSHTYQPYEYWHPIVEKIKSFLYKNYRFTVD